MATRKGGRLGQRKQTKQTNDIDLQKLKKAELQAILKKQNLSVSGTKAVLIKRIQEAKK